MSYKKRNLAGIRKLIKRYINKTPDLDIEKLIGEKMITIYKYKLEICSEQYIEMPIDAKILFVGVINETPYLWAQVCTDNKTEMRRITTYGTGAPSYDKNANNYISSYFLLDGKFVGHVFSDDNK